MDNKVIDPYRARNCYTCLPPEGCPYPRPGGARVEDCPWWNDDVRKTTTSTICPEREGKYVRLGVCADCKKKKGCSSWKPKVVVNG